MNALQYEKLIKMAHQCHRNGVRGASAEVYRNMDRAMHELRYPDTSLHSIEQLEHIARIARSEVRAYTENAIRKAVTIVKAEDKEALNQLLVTVSAINCERQLLDNIIGAAVDILEKNNIVEP